MGTILVVDDEKSIRITFREFLTGDGHEVEIAATADEAIPILKARNFDVVITDIIMPRVTGVDLLKTISGINSKTKVIMMTGEPNVETSTQSLRFGAFDYLFKPISKEKILKTVSNALRIKRLEDDKSRLEQDNQNYQENLEELVKERTRELQKSEKKYRDLIDLAQEGIWLIDKDNKTEFVNPSMAKMLGYTPAEMKGKLLFEFMDAEGSILAENNIKRRSEGITEQHDFEFIRKDGNRIITTLEAAPIMDKDRNYQGAIAGIIDITKRKNAEERVKSSLKEKEILLRELYHRTKNNMQVIISMINLQTQNIKDKNTLQVYKEIMDKINSMALVHEKLYQAKDLSRVNLKDYFEELIDLLTDSYLNDRICIKTHLESIFVTIDEAIPCGLILNELISNIYKHAFPKNQSGDVLISLNKNEKHEISITVKDNGIGLPNEININTINSVGLQSVVALAEHQLQGKIDLKSHKGAQFYITFHYCPK